MTPDQYNMTLTIFFITYSLFGTKFLKLPEPYLLTRGPIQYLSQAIQTSYMASNHHGPLGSSPIVDGLC